MQKQLCIAFGKKRKNRRRRRSSTTKESFICSKHFKDSDSVYDANNTNAQRKSINTEMSKRGCIPTKFQNCPSYLSKKKPVERPSFG